MRSLINFLNHKINSFKRNIEAAAAVEFAIVMLPFFLIIVGTVQMTLLYFTKVILDTGMQSSVIMFKNSHNSNRAVKMGDIRANLCDKKNLLISCDEDNLLLDVSRLKDFTGGIKPINPGNLEGLRYQFDEIIVVRANYKFQMNFPISSDDIMTLSSFAIIPPTSKK